MGFTHLKVFVGNPTEWTRGREVEFLIDSGAFYTMIPRAILEEVGVVPIKEQTFTLANGQEIRRQVGTAYLSYKDRPGATLVIFGEEGDETSMGVLGLESMGFKLDPIKMELEPIKLLV
jgi:predicted aspartyl protease